MKRGRLIPAVGLAAALLVCGVVFAGGAPVPAVSPRVFSVSPGALTVTQARLATHDAGLLPALRKLTNDANRALLLRPVSVMDKTRPGASGDKHDYYSQAPYFWPDPARPDGRPYVRRDGQRNPESQGEHSDAPRLAKMADTAETLALAYFFTGHEAYAAHAARGLRVWFLDPATRMNPHLDQAQAVPGVNNGRGTGMIESRHLTAVCDAAGLLGASSHWTAADEAGLRAWMRAFLDWARTSANGREEQAAKNNHGSWYDVQTAHLALYIGETNLAGRIIASARTNRVARQFEPDGRQPLEIAREDSFSYSRFNLQALFALAVLGEHAGADLWHHEAPNGASLRRGLDFLLPYSLEPDRPWPFRKGKAEKLSLTPLLRRAAAAWRSDRYRQAWEADATTRNAREQLLLPLN